MRELLVATNNPGKQREFQRLLAPLGATLLMPQDLALDLTPDEPHLTYSENARAKAEAFCAATGLISLADDAGIEVAALGGRPGVDTAHFGSDLGRDGVDLLLETLSDEADRRARMVCWLAIGIPGADHPRVELFSGTMEGAIVTERRGTGGFGFDPVFEFPDGATAAELSPDEKDRRSHRGRAVAAALPRLRELLAD